MTDLSAERLAELKREDWPRFSLDHILRETGRYNVEGRSGPIGRDLSKDAAEDLARVSGCTVEAVPISPGNRAILSAAEVPEHARLINSYLRHFVPGECPSCGHGMFSWGVVHGSGFCSCGWPGTLYHYIVDDRELPTLICRATCNGHDVCGRLRGDHELVEERWFSVSTGEPSIHEELRCPNPKAPPGVRQETFSSRYHPPEIVSFQSLLWAHPYDVHQRP